MATRKKGPPQSHDAEPSPHWRTATQVQQRDARWILPGRLLAGCLAILEGETSVGKSTFVASLIAAITTGRPWLGRPKSTPGNVLYVASEEDYGSSIRPRLIAAGADESRILTPALDDAGEVRRVYLSTGVGLLREAITRHNLDLVVVEPLASAVGPEHDLCQAGHAHAVLDPINSLGTSTGCTILATRGLVKGRGGASRVSHGQGSPAIADTARSVLVIDRPDPQSMRRVLRVVKCSNSSGTPALEFFLEGEAGEVLVVARERDLDRSEDDDVADVADAGDRDMREDARRLLIALCPAGKWERVTVITEAARCASISERTLRRAKADLCMKTRQLADGSGNYHEWGPPGEDIPAAPPPTRPVGSVGLSGRKKRKKGGETD